MFPRTLIIAAATAVLLTGCTAAPRTADPAPAVSSGMSLSPDQIQAFEDRLPEPVKAALKEMRSSEGAHAINVGDEVWALITAGEKPGYSVVIVDTATTDGKIRVTYELQAPAAVSSAPGVTHPYNAQNLGKGKAADVTFTKAAGAGK